MRLRRLVEGRTIDALVLVLLAVGITEIWTNDEVEGPAVVLTALALVWGLALLLRGRFPVGAPLTVFGVLVLQTIIWPRSVPYMFATFAMALLATGLLSVALVGTRARLLGAGLAVGAFVVVVARDPDGDWTNLLSTLPAAGIAWLVGHAYRTQTQRTAELRERAERLERERESEARAAVAEERARIAREMHDVVAHSLSVMVVQAEAAEAMLDTDPERARRPLGAVQETGRGALNELRRMLGVLREMADEDPALAPQAGLGELDALVGHVRAAGLPVEVRVEGDPRPLPPGIDLSAYRIVQEGLTNTLKHAGPARAHVTLTYGQQELRLEVSDDGRGHDPSDDGLGHGLLGMRERVACYGGELEAGPRDGAAGGFALRARLPLDAGARA